MMAVQVVLDGRAGAIARGTEMAVRHVADALLGTRGDVRALDLAMARVREDHAWLAAAGLDASDCHLLRLYAALDPTVAAELVWRDLDPEPGLDGIVLRYDLEGGDDVAFCVLDALASVVRDGGDPDYAAHELGLRIERMARPAGSPWDARARFTHLRRVQALFCVPGGALSKLLPHEWEISGDHAGALLALRARAGTLFREALASPGISGAARA